MSRLRIGLVLCVLSLLAGTAGQARGQDTNPFAGDAAAIAEGEALFQAVCTGYCHVLPGSERNAKAPSLFDCESKYGNSDKEMFQVLLDGVPNTEMAPWKGQLPDEMLWQILAYVKSASQCQEGKAADGQKTAAIAAHE